ncbi:unnamed protein product [Moneuplotes crassus]|uniref:PDEase domain-containing protein n=1 Tax=Euplotes crassus TaxID=5936 RepID=A0AAD1UQL9_EUPCR|nr:unnamed protein product [Moneuplotes crassus]
MYWFQSPCNPHHSDHPRHYLHFSGDHHWRWNSVRDLQNRRPFQAPQSRNFDQEFDSIRQKRNQIKDIYHVSSPADTVNEILAYIRDIVQNDDRLIEDLNYCIKMISSGKLYETNVFDRDNGIDDKGIEALTWIKSVQGKSKNQKRSSTNAKMMIQNNLQCIDINSVLNLTKESSGMLDCVDAINDFNIFDFKAEVEENELFVISSFLLNKHLLFQNSKIDPETYFKFVKRIQNNYNPVWIKYHNKTHGADVCQTSFFFLEGCIFMSTEKITDYELMPIVFSPSCHDFEHLVVNNKYLVDTKAKLALECNDKSLLKNHHVASTFMLIENSQYNVFKDINLKDYIEVRKNMTKIVITTDAGHHFNKVGNSSQESGVVTSHLVEMTR